jgi:hypothetical protein
LPVKAYRCSDAATEREEPLYGTASFVRRWLLIEQPGSWGPDALIHSRMPARVATELRRRAREAGIRIVLIRRGVRFSSQQRQCYFVRTDDRGLYQSHLAVKRVDELLDIDLSPLSQGAAVAGAEERRDALFLICTHGRHDPCCSRHGNKVSRIACAQAGLDVWECSHIGGDRFAANLVCFPHGVYYGRVGVDNVVALMDGYARGSLALDHYRGRSCYPFAVQAAEYFVRHQTAATGVDEVSLVEVGRAADSVTAEFTVAGRFHADVEVAVAAGGAHRLTCGSTRPELIPRYDLVSLKLRDL